MDKKEPFAHKCEHSARVHLLIVLSAALPVRAYANLPASRVPTTSLAPCKWVSDINAASESDVRMKCFACSLQAVTLHCVTFDLTIRNFQFALPACVSAPSRFRVTAEGISLFSVNHA